MPLSQAVHMAALELQMALGDKAGKGNFWCVAGGPPSRGCSKTRQRQRRPVWFVPVLIMSADPSRRGAGTSRAA